MLSKEQENIKELIKYSFSSKGMTSLLSINPDTTFIIKLISSKYSGYGEKTVETLSFNGKWNYNAETQIIHFNIENGEHKSESSDGSKPITAQANIIVATWDSKDFNWQNTSIHAPILSNNELKIWTDGILHRK